MAGSVSLERVLLESVLRPDWGAVRNALELNFCQFRRAVSSEHRDCAVSSSLKQALNGCIK